MLLLYGPLAFSVVVKVVVKFATSSTRHRDSNLLQTRYIDCFNFIVGHKTLRVLYCNTVSPSKTLHYLVRPRAVPCDALLQYIILGLVPISGQGAVCHVRIRGTSRRKIRMRPGV
jgi:hypothetical protein